MGHQMSKLERKVVSGDEDAAVEIIRNYPKNLPGKLNAKKSLGIQYEYHTLLHMATLHAMPNLLRVLLEDFGADPNRVNDSAEKSSLVVCTRSKDFKTDFLERHKECLRVLLQWRDTMMTDGLEGKMKLTRRNIGDNTALHLIAADGLVDCVEELIKAGISPFVVNNDSFTPHGLARVLGSYCTAFVLDTIMTFDKEVMDEERSNLKMREDDEACYSFDFKRIFDLIDGDLDDMLTLRTIDEVLERNNSCKFALISEYYRERLTIKWTTDLVHCFQLAGIPISRPVPSTQYRTVMGAILNSSADERYVICPVCVTTVKASSRPSIRMKCGHNFCSSCWQAYLTEKIDYECQISILCPIYNCRGIVPDHVVESLINTDLIRKYRSLKLMTLINSGNFIKWCPVSNCGLAVRLSVPKYWRKVYEPLEEMGLMPSRAVECGNGHYFCWECLGSCHAPMPCDQWQMWLKRTREHDPGAIPKKIKECAEVVNHLWIAEKSKVCPMCHAPTQENDGCKYMSCTQCEYVFRYVCLGVCEIKPTLTGGLVECITPNEYRSSPRGGHISSIRHEEGSDIDEASRWEFIGCIRHESSDMDEASVNGPISSIRHEEGPDVDEALRCDVIGCTIHETPDVNEAFINGHISSIKHKEGPDMDEASGNGHVNSIKQEESSDMDEASINGHISSIKHEEGPDMDEASGNGHVNSIKHEGPDTDEVSGNGHVNSIKKEEGPDMDEASGNGHVNSIKHGGPDTDEASGNGHVNSIKKEEGSDMDEASRCEVIGCPRHEGGSDVDEASRNGHIRCSRHKECSDVDEALGDGHICLSRRTKSSDVNERERGRYILILHKEFSDLDDALGGGYYTFNRLDDGYEMIDRLRARYFKCTRYEEFYDVDETDEKLWTEAIMRTRERRGLKKFNRYYLKYMDMLKLLEREKYYYKVICDKVEYIKRVLMIREDSPEKGKEKTQFLIDGMLELLRLRETLASSYAYAFYLDEMGFNTELICRQQKELEDLIKKFMDMIVIPQNRKHSDLPPRAAIINLTVTSRRARYRFIRVVINSLHKQDLFSAIKRERRRLRNRNFGSGHEGKEANHYSVVSSAGAEKLKSSKNHNYSWLDFTMDSEFKTKETLPGSRVGPYKERGYKRPKIRNSELQRANYFCAECVPYPIQYPENHVRPWRSVEIRQKIPHATAEGMENRNAFYLSSTTRTPQDVIANGATALYIQQQKTDVGVTIGNVIQEADAVKSAHHSETNGDPKDERVFDTSFENDFQGATKIVKDTYSHDTEEILGEKVDRFKPNQSEDGSCTNLGGLEASFSTENSKEKEQLVGDAETNTHLNFDFEEKEEVTEQSPKPIEKPEDKMSRDSTIPDFQYFQQSLPARTTEGEATKQPLNYVKTEAKISFLSESSIFGEMMEPKNNTVKVIQNEFMDSNRSIEKEFAKPALLKNLLDEASNASTFFKQEDYFGDPTNCPQTSHVKHKGSECSRYCPEMVSTGKTNDGEMVLENQETDFRSAAEFLNLKDRTPRPFPTKKEDFCAPQTVRSDYNLKKEHKKPSKSDSGEYLTKKHSLHTDDSSCEYESITGLPKSPNLCISGVFITRTPESGHISRKDAQMLQSSSATGGRYYSSPKVQEALEKYKATGRMFAHGGGSDRSSSLSDRGYNSNRLSAGLISTSHTDRNPYFSHRSVTPPRYSFTVKDDPKANRTLCNFDKMPSHSVKDSQVEIAKETEKSKLGSEPEERRMFPLHKSPTEGALSSVLYVNENYSSEDDFHEVLFLLGRSQKDPSKRKKKKDRDRKMEFSYKEDRDDFSSAL